jgi:hypothetical protein
MTASDIFQANCDKLIQDLALTSAADRWVFTEIVSRKEDVKTLTMRSIRDNGIGHMSWYIYDQGRMADLMDQFGRLLEKMLNIEYRVERVGGIKGDTYEIWTFYRVGSK